MNRRLGWSLVAIAMYLVPFILMADVPEVKKVQIGDVEIAYYIRGTGKPLLMINGYKSTLASWDPALISDLEKSHQLILFDHRGVGLSTDSKEDRTTMAQMADDAAALIKALGFEKAHVLGWSMGARIAQQLVIRHPENVDKVILCAPNPGGSHQVAASEEASKRLNTQGLSPLKSVEMFYAATPEGIKAAQEYLDRLKSAVESKTIPNDFIVSPETIERQDRAKGAAWNNSNENFEALSKIKAPVLITDGKLDIVDLPENVKIIANQIPFSWVAYFEGGHAYLFEYHKQFADLVKVFLNDQ